MYNTPVKKAIVITGPTGVGKSAFALKLAHQINGALISVDSIHIYKGCDIISGKDIPKNAKFHSNQNISVFNTGYWDIGGIPLYLTDVIPPTYEFNVSDYLRLLKTILPQIESLGKVPIFVGGSTLYIRSLLTPIATINIPPNMSLREKLESATVDELQAVLAKYNKKKLAQMNDSDIKNPRRLLRAIEISLYEKDHKATTDQKIPDYEFLTFVLNAPTEVLQQRVANRVESRVTEGAVNEAKDLFKIYTNLSPSVRAGSGYKKLFSSLKGEISEQEAIRQWEVSDMQYTKKQLTFFQKLPDAYWIDTAQNNYEDEIITQVQKWLLSDQNRNPS